MTQTKPGKKTTELAVTLVAQILGVLATTGLITPDFQAAWAEGAAQLGGLLTTAIASGMYAISRARTKAAELQVEASRIHADATRIIGEANAKARLIEAETTAKEASQHDS